MLLTGAQIVIECLKEQQVDTVFGYPGGTILNIYDELYLHEKEIRHIRTSHEQGAAHAADGYARSTGKVGVCMATSGPGSTNLVTGLATAYMDSIPMVAITCNVNLPLLGKDSFQEVDMTGVTMPITKHGFIVKDIKQLAPTIRRAFQIASSGRKGPVVVDITKDVTQLKCEFTKKKPEPLLRPKKYDEQDIEQAVALIQKSKKPFLLVGGGAISADAGEELAAFLTKMDAPVSETLMGISAFDEDNPYFTGMIGMHGTKASNLAVSECDLLIALGARFSDRVIGNPKTFASKAKKLHIDIDPAEINKNIKADASIVGDLKEILTDLNRALPAQSHPQWTAHVEELKHKFPMQYDQTRLTCPYIVETLNRLTKGNAILSTDVGQHQIWTAQYFTFHKPRTFLTSGGLGTMGYGLGACIGAKAGNPNTPCINIGGDGCFRMNMNELATASSYHLPVIQIIINNHVLGMVRQWQTLFYQKHYSATVLDSNVDYCKVAEALGCKALRITRREEVEDALLEALHSDQPVVIDAVILEDDKVFPMVPAGAPVSECFDEEDLKKREEKN